jgi:hypothetical protein
VSDELKPGDRVSHQTLGNGVIPNDHHDFVNHERGVAFVILESSDGVGEWIALDMLTKTEQSLYDQFKNDPKMSLHGKLYAMFERVSEPAEMAEQVFRDHFDSKRDVIESALRNSASRSYRIHETDMTNRIRSVLFGDRS